MSKSSYQEKSDSFVKFGSAWGLVITTIIGFMFYFTLSNITAISEWIPYEKVISSTSDSISYKFIWGLINFTEPQFYAGIFASIGMILGGFIAWRLDTNKSKYAGFDICYGTNLFPWIFASQIISLFLAIFVFKYTRFFQDDNVTWLPTFICIVGLPPSIILKYGPNYKALFTGSILGGLICFPVSFWLLNNIAPLTSLPNATFNVLTMAITGIIGCQACKILPWMKVTPINAIKKEENNRTKEENFQNMLKPVWFVRRVLADFSEPQFYGNEIASILCIAGVCIDWIFNRGNVTSGAGALPAILLSQFIGGGVGVYLYTYKYFEKGWYATYVPVVCVAPACVLMFGATIPVAVFSGVLGGIIGAPVAEYFAYKMPEHIHTTNANVLSMALCTLLVAVVMNALPWF